MRKTLHGLPLARNDRPCKGTRQFAERNQLDRRLAIARGDYKAAAQPAKLRFVDEDIRGLSDSREPPAVYH